MIPQAFQEQCPIPSVPEEESDRSWVMQLLGIGAPFDGASLPGGSPCPVIDSIPVAREAIDSLVRVRPSSEQ